MPQAIARFDKVVLRQLRPKIDEALVQLGREFGISFHVGNASFQAKEVTFKLVATVLDESGVAVDMEAEAFKTYAQMYGFSPSDLGRTFTQNEKTYKIAGLSTRSKKYPILGDDVRTGARFKFRPEGIRRQFDRQDGRQSPQIRTRTLNEVFSEAMTIGSSDVGSVESVFGIVPPSTGTAATSGARGNKRPYLPRIKELVAEGRWTAKDIVSKIMQEFPTATKSSVQTVVTDLKNPKYSALKPLEVMVAEGGELYFATTAEA